MGDYVVTTDFKAHDMVSPTLKAIEARNKQFANRTHRTFSQIFKGSFVGTLGANLVTSGLARARMGVVNLVEEYKDFDTTLNAAAVKFGNIEYGSAEFKELGAVAREVGRTTKFTSGDAAGGLMAMAGAGFEAENALSLLPHMANFAAAAKLNLAEATDVAGGALNAFGMNAKDAATQGANLTRIADVMAEADRMSMASMQGLSETVAWGAADFQSAGQSIESFMAIAAGLADVKKSGSVAGTIMRGMARNFATLGDAGRKALIDLAGPIDFEGPVDFIAVLKRMEPKLKSLSDLGRTKALSKIFDARVASGVSAMFTQGIDKIEQYRGRLIDTSGTAKRAGDQLNKSLTFRIMALQNAFREKGFQVFENFLTDGQGGIESMIEAVNKWDVQPIADAMRQIAKAFAFAAKHTDDIIRIGKAFLMIKGATVAMDAVRWLRQMPGVVGGIGGMSMPIGQFMRGGGGGGVVPTAVPTAPLTPAQAGGLGAGWYMGAGGKTRYTSMRTPGSIKTVSKLNVGNVANGVFTGLAAAGAGWQVGKILDQYLFEPIRQFSDKWREQSDNLLSQTERLKSGRMSEEELLQVRRESKKLAETGGAALVSPSTVIGMFHSLFDDSVTNPLVENINKRVQSVMMYKEAGMQLERMYTAEKQAQEQQWQYEEPMRAREAMDNLSRMKQESYTKSLDEYSTKQTELNGLYDTYLKQLEKLNESTREAAAQGGTAVVNINISGEGAGKVTTKTKTSGPKAPSVDVSKAGQN